MSNYVKTTDFAAKDALTTGSPAKIVKGTEIDNELIAIGTAIATKADLASPTFTGVPLTTTPAYSDDSTKIASTAFVRDVIPAGIISMWSGTIATIPLGWLLCDGTSGTPDLRDKFIIGATADSSGAKTNVTGSYTQTGGSKDAIVVSHSHTISGHQHYVTTNGVQGNQSLSNSNYVAYDTRVSGGVFSNENFEYVLGGTSSGANAGLTSSSGTQTSSTEGSSGTNANLPPYFALAFIMKS